MVVTLSRPQSLAHRALRRGNTVCIPWGRGVGKSFFQRLIWYLLIEEWDGRYRPGAPHPGVRIVLLMPTLEQAKKVHLKLLQDEIDEQCGQWRHLGLSINKQDWRITAPGGSWVQWVTAERATNIRGMRCDVVCIDEADDVDIEVHEAIVDPWFSEHHSLGMTIVGGTPTRGRYGLLYKMFRLGMDGAVGHYAFHATYKDVPEFVNVERVDARRPYIDKELFAREWLCSFDAAEALVYGIFRESFHVRRPDPKIRWTEFLVGADFGWEDPGVFLVAGVQGSGKDASIHILEEVYEQHRANAWWNDEAKRIVKKYPNARWYPDPSRPDRVADLRACGARVQDVDNSIDAGVAAVADRLVVRSYGERCEPCDGLGCALCATTTAAQARLYVDPSCVNTIAEMGKYRRKRDPRNRERVLDDIIDKDNHAMDSLRYLTFSRFGGPSRTRTESGAGW